MSNELDDRHEQRPTDSARETFDNLSDAALEGILDNLADRFGEHELVIAHDAAVVDKEQ